MPRYPGMEIGDWRKREMIGRKDNRMHSSIGSGICKILEGEIFAHHAGDRGVNLTTAPDRIACGRCGSEFDCSLERGRMLVRQGDLSGSRRHQGVLCPRCLRLAAHALVGARVGSVS